VEKGLVVGGMRVCVVTVVVNGLVVGGIRVRVTTVVAVAVALAMVELAWTVELAQRGAWGRFSGLQTS